MKKLFALLLIFTAIAQAGLYAQSSDTIVLRDINWDKSAPAGSTELFIPSENSLMAGVIYRANGPQKHPTLLLLHGYPGNERNLDIAQVLRSRGWNVIYFDYRGSWGSQGQFSFDNCVQDVVNLVAFCKKYQDSLRIDTSNMVLFGHSMGGWVCMKALQRLPGIKKGFCLSAWNIADGFENVKTEDEFHKIVLQQGPQYFVLNTPTNDLFDPVFKNLSHFDLKNDGKALANIQLVMLDEHSGNRALAEAIKSDHKAYFDYQVWDTDHPFSNKRVALIKKLWAFLQQ